MLTATDGTKVMSVEEALDIVYRMAFLTFLDQKDADTPELKVHMKRQEEALDIVHDMVLNNLDDDGETVRDWDAEIAQVIAENEPEYDCAMCNGDGCEMCDEKGFFTQEQVLAGLRGSKAKGRGM